MPVIKGFLADVGRHAWVGISDFHGAMRIPDWGTYLYLNLSAVITDTHVKMLNALVRALGVSYLQISADLWSPCVSQNLKISWHMLVALIDVMDLVRNRIYMPFARKPWLTIYSAH